jgi:hypothetical protein
MSEQAKIGSTRFHDKSIKVTFVLDTSAYASGDLMAQPVKLENASLGDQFGAMTTLHAVTVADVDDQGANFTVVFHKSNPGSMGALNATPSVAGKLGDYVGFVAMDAFKDLTTGQVGCVDNIGLPMETSSDGHLWAWLLSEGAGTYASGAIDIIFNFYRS